MNKINIMPMSFDVTTESWPQEPEPLLMSPPLQPLHMTPDLQEFYCKEQIKTAGKISIDRNRAMLNERREHLKYELAEKRDLQKCISVSYLLEKEGELIVQRSSLSGDITKSVSICREKNFRTFILKSAMSPMRLLKITWQDDPQGIVIRMDEKDFPQKLFRTFCLKGVTFNFPRRDRKNLERELIKIFIKEAKEKEISDHIGWNRLPRGGWEFVSDATLTWRAIYDKV